MLNFPHDQAAGLRRLMATPKPRVMSMISAAAKPQPSYMLSNLAATIHALGNKVLLIEATGYTEELNGLVDHLPALLDVANGQSLLMNAITDTDYGFYCAKLKHPFQQETILDTFETQQLGFVFEELTHQFDVILVNAKLDQQHLLPIAALNDSEILVQMTREPSSIKQAYALIKRMCSQIGNRNFSIVVDNATEEQAEPVFNNIAEVAWRFMKIQLSFFGAIPNDEHLLRAAYLGRSVVDAFPMANASNAFYKIAEKVHKKPKRSVKKHSHSII
jgi:flagellar biosynthesis protein FlhG